MEPYIPYLIGAAVVLVLNKLGINLPLQPPLQPATPSPAPSPLPSPVVVPQPGADRELVAALAWCQQATIGAVRVDPEDRVALAALVRASAPILDVQPATSGGAAKS